jgi:hypothetical protein
MADSDKNSAKPWPLYIGTMVMAGVAIIAGIDSGIAAALGNDDVTRTSLGTACSFAFAALGSLAYALWLGRRTPS